MCKNCFQKLKTKRSSSYDKIRILNNDLKGGNSFNEDRNKIFNQSSLSKGIVDELPIYFSKNSSIEKSNLNTNQTGSQTNKNT
jgi:hypothetical protein